MSNSDSLEAIRTSSAAGYRKGLDDVAQQRSRKLTQSRMLTENDIDALAVLEYAAQDVLQKYHAAMRQMEVRLETLDQDLKLRQRRNPIHHIESRMKSVPSIFEKLERYGKSATLESMEANIMDIAGLRVIVSYVQDAYDILHYLEHQDDLSVITVKDYIAHPKPNGYRSLHLIVRIPVYFLDSKEDIPVEIQIRTIAMDFWASLEHDLKYKSVREIEGVDIGEELRQCSAIIKGVEERMQVLAQALDDGARSKPKAKAVDHAKTIDLAAEVEWPACAVPTAPAAPEPTRAFKPMRYLGPH
ncbi:MAG: GTP pyrophosphokinase family protein [Eggerthellaceae bacterium]|nr:GTP pyrophosphokinase family protein [Eggerthellaceae bacterium]